MDKVNRTSIPESEAQLVALLATLRVKPTEEAVGQPITAELYKRPKPTDNPDLAPYFAWKGQIGCTRHIDVGDAMFGAELKDEVARFFAELTPLYEYFNRFKV